MNPSQRYVFDTNVLISAVFLTQGTPRRAFDYALEFGRILLSEEIATEVQRVFSLEKFSRYVTIEERERFLRTLVRETELVEIDEAINECRDPKDNKFLELAVNGKASHIITGDTDLLELHPFRSIQTITPQLFVNSMSV